MKQEACRMLADERKVSTLIQMFTTVLFHSGSAQSEPCLLLDSAEIGQVGTSSAKDPNQLDTGCE